MIKRFAESYADWLKRSPIVSRCLTTGTLVSLGDAIAQNVFNADQPFNWKRYMRAFVVGSFGTAPNLYLWYMKGLPKIMSHRLFDKCTPFQRGLISVTLDQGIFSWWIISNYLFWVNFYEHFDFSRAFQNVQANLFTALKMNFLYWPMIQFVNLTYVGILYRVLVVNLASILWNLYLSYINQKAKSAQLVPTSKLE